MLPKLVVALTALGLLIPGLGVTYTYLNYPQPASYRLEDYLVQRPKEPWLILKDCFLDLAEVSFEGSEITDRAYEVNVPLRPVGSRPSDPTFLLVSTRDEEVTALVEELLKVSEDDRTEFLDANQDRFILKRDVEGLVVPKNPFNYFDRVEIRDLHSNLAKDFIVLDEDLRPSPGGFALIAIGLFLVWLTIFKVHPRFTFRKPGLQDNAENPALQRSDAQNPLNRE